jgi:hypothetical protein
MVEKPVLEDDEYNEDNGAGEGVEGWGSEKRQGEEEEEEDIIDDEDEGKDKVE